MGKVVGRHPAAFRASHKIGYVKERRRRKRSNREHRGPDHTGNKMYITQNIQFVKDLEMKIF